jgi:hypothetical protein
MSAAKLVFTMLCFSICAHAQTQTLAVYSRSAPPLDSLTQHSLNQELMRLLSPADIQVVWRNQNRELSEESGRLVVGSFDGDCSVENLPSYASPLAKAATLAESSMSDGRVIPYFTVDCARMVRTLAPTLQHLSVPFRSAVLGRALARVIAHEIYHIVAETVDHEKSGLSKAQLSLTDLIETKFEFSPDSLRRIRVAIRSLPPLPVAALLAPGSIR